MLKLINAGIWSLFISQNAHCQFIVSQAAFPFFGILDAFLVILSSKRRPSSPNRIWVSLIGRDTGRLPVALAGGGGAGHGFLKGLQETVDVPGAEGDGAFLHLGVLDFAESLDVGIRSVDIYRSFGPSVAHRFMVEVRETDAIAAVARGDVDGETDVAGERAQR